MIGKPFKKGHKPWNKIEHIFNSCLHCGKEFDIQPYRKNTAFYCSKYCKYQHQKFLMKNNKYSISVEPWNKGKKGVQPRSEETKQKISRSLKGMKHPNVTNEWRKGKPRLDMSGSKHWNWKNGKSHENKTERQLMMNSLEYKIWRESVFERDQYKCVKCFRGGELNADHKKPWSVFPELRYAIDNGQTLCKACHKDKTKADMIMYFGHEYRRIN